MRDLIPALSEKNSKDSRFYRQRDVAFNGSSQTATALFTTMTQQKDSVNESNLTSC